MSELERKCPQCACTEHDQAELSDYASAWPVLFGRIPFAKRELTAYACKACGFVSLYVKPRRE